MSGQLKVADSAVDFVLNLKKLLVEMGHGKLLESETKEHHERYQRVYGETDRGKEWLQNLPQVFRDYESHYRDIPPEVTDLGNKYRLIGATIVKDERYVLEYLHEVFEKPPKALENYKPIISGIRLIAWRNYLIGEIFTKKTPPIIREIEGDIGRYKEICVELYKQLV